MSHIQRRLLLRGAILALLLVLIFILSRYGPQPIAVVDILGEEFEDLGKFYSNSARIRGFLTSLGTYSSAVFILIQALQVLVSPIPGEFTGIVGGYVYGKVYGFALSTVGLTLGSWLAFELSRVLGRRFIEKFVNKKVLEKFQFLTTNTGSVVCFVLFVFPGFPKDALCYLLGMSRMRLSTFLVIVTIGRMPGTLILSFQGASLQNQQYVIAVTLVAAGAAGLLLVYLFRDPIIRWLKNSKALNGSS